jgi:MerR family transcriptional regulator, light-induced transcriptional regulator
VSEIVALTGLRQPNVSNHLAKLRQEGVVLGEKRGRSVYYALTHLGTHAVSRLETPALLSEVGVPLSEEELTQYAERYFAALVDGSEQRAKKAATDVLRRNPPLEDLYVGVLQTAMAKIGEWYLRGRITEAEEHFATNLTERMMANAVQQYAPAPPNGKLAVLGCVAGNHHTLGLRMLADMLELEGWSVKFLGSDVPTPSLVKMITDDGPDLVLVSCAQPRDVDAARQITEAVLKLKPRPRVFVGGSGIDDPAAIGAERGPRDARAFRKMLRAFS